ncbi:MAG TPA: hypothetical protein VFC99_22035 [Acidimicrobiia bacterium]|nr:hypothetical protein [Acidimicrobiia bacterium]
MRCRTVLRRLTAAVAALGITGAAAVATVAVDTPAAHAADSRAVVVVDTGSGVRRSVISFGGTITGLQALQLAGANPVTYGYAGQGTAVCALDGVGHDATQSSCLGTLDDPRYWAYFRSPAGSSGWTYSRGCACTSTVHDGDVEGWRYGTGQSPAYVSFCAAAGCAPPPTAAPTTAAPPPPSVQGTSVGAPQHGGGARVGAPGDPGSGASSGGTTTGGSGASANGTSPGDSTTSTPAGNGTSHGPGATRDSGKQGTGERASASSGRSSGGDSGGGSPWGVVGAVVLVGGLGVGGWWLRRRRVASPPAG